MPIKRVQFPDGSIHRVEVPEGATDEQIIEFVKNHHPAAKSANDSDFGRMVSGKKKPGAYEQFRKNLHMMPHPALAEGALDLMDAAQHHIGSQMAGFGQLIHKGVTAAADLLPEDNSVRQWADRIDRRGAPALAKREANYQHRVPDSGAAYTGAAVGEALPWMTGIGELRAAGLLPQVTAGGLKGLAQKGGLLALEGAAYGAGQPVMEDGSYAAQKGAQVALNAAVAPVTAGALVAAGKGAGGLAALARYATPGGREAIANERLARMYGDSPEVLASLRTGTGVEGFDLTPAQAIGTPEAVQAERLLRNNALTAPAFAGRESANNAAARNQVARVAGSDADMAAALEARREGPGAFWKDNLPRGAEDNRYGRAAAHLADFIKSKPLPMPEFNILSQARKIAGQVERGTISQAEGDAAIRALAPSTKGGKKALEQALGLIDNGMVNPDRIIAHLQGLSRDTNPSISKAADAALAALAKNQDGQGWVHARVLDGLRQNFGKLIADSSPHGVVGSAEGAVYGPLKAKIANTLDRAVPGYRNNLAAYASASAPINDMQAGRALLAAIDSGARDGGGNQTVSLAQVKALLSKDNRANFPMSDSARQQIEAVLEVLQKRSIANNNIAASGPGSAADLQRAVQASPLLMRILGHGASVGGGVALGPMGYLAGAGVTELANAANSSVVRKLGAKAASAKETAAAIEAARNKQPLQLPWADALLPYEYRALPPPR